MQIQQSMYGKAQFYLDELERRKLKRQRAEDTVAATRSHKNELIIIWLIVLELLVGGGTLIFSISEGRAQAKALEAIQQAAQTTANMVIRNQPLPRLLVPSTPSTPPRPSGNQKSRQ